MKTIQYLRHQWTSTRHCQRFPGVGVLRWYAHHRQSAMCIRGSRYQHRHSLQMRQGWWSSERERVIVIFILCNGNRETQTYHLITNQDTTAESSSQNKPTSIRSSRDSLCKRCVLKSDSIGSDWEWACEHNAASKAGWDENALTAAGLNGQITGSGTWWHAQYKKIIWATQIEKWIEKAQNKIKLEAKNPVNPSEPNA